MCVLQATQPLAILLRSPVHLGSSARTGNRRGWCGDAIQPALTFRRLRLEYCDGLGNDVRCFGPEVFERAQRSNRVQHTVFADTPANDLPAFADAE
jgi:hypothetical protein